MNRWWVLHDDDLRRLLARVEVGEVTKEEAYAVLTEQAESDRVRK